MELAAMQRRRAAQHGVVDRLTSDAQRRQCVQQELARMRRLNDLPLACKLQARACVSSSVAPYTVCVCPTSRNCAEFQRRSPWYPSTYPLTRLLTDRLTVLLQHLRATPVSTRHERHPVVSHTGLEPQTSRRPQAGIALLLTRLGLALDSAPTSVVGASRSTCSSCATHTPLAPQG